MLGKSSFQLGIFLAVVAALTFLGRPIPGGGEVATHQAVPEFRDWSTRHVVYSNWGYLADVNSASSDPRAIFSWRARLIGPYRRFPPLPPIPRPRPRPVSSALQRDWSIYLGTAGTAQGMYPAKFTFDVTATPSCANDFIVFPIAGAGSSSQPNIVAFNNLYSGTAGANGICNRTVSGSDNGTAAAVYWSYNVQAISGGGAVTTSPTIYFDPISGATNTGQKVAFVESGTGAAHFHVLAWKSGDGQNQNSGYSQSVGLAGIAWATLSAGGTGYAVGDAGTIAGGTPANSATYQVTAIGGGGAVTAFAITNAGAAYSVANGVATTHTSGAGNNGFKINITALQTPKTINTFVSAAPVAGSGTATDLLFSSSSDTLSSPFVDYVYDKAYVGSDAGVLYRIKDVFCTKVNPDCPGTSGSGTPAPSLDATWGTGGAITVCSGTLSAPVLDYATYNVFVGCSDGKLYSVSQTGTITSVVVGDGVASKTYGAIVDPPIVDGMNGFVYAVSGSASSGANGVLVQAKTTNLSSSSAATAGAGNQCNMHAPAPNNAYYTSPTTAGALIYIAGVTGAVSQPCTANSTGGQLSLFAVTFNGSTGVMNSGAPAHTDANVGTPGNEWSPLLEFYNATTSIDWLYAGVIDNPPPDIASVNITAGFPTGFGTVFTEGLGTSGMIVDNNSASAQAASIYFNSLMQNAACNNTTSSAATGGCAVKLTQAGLE